jgi:hypothetical protein
LIYIAFNLGVAHTHFSPSKNQVDCDNKAVAATTHPTAMPIKTPTEVGKWGVGTSERVSALVNDSKDASTALALSLVIGVGA